MKDSKMVILKVIVALLVLGLGVYFIYDKSKIDDKKQENNSPNSETLDDGKEEDSKAFKIDNNKDWVYDAEYQSGVNVESYTTNFDETYYLKDIVVPFINVDSTYGTRANSEIKAVYDKAIDVYKKGIDNKLAFIQCSYDKQIVNDNLSVVLTYGEGGTSTILPEYYTYNVNLKSGSELSYQDVYRLAGFSDDEIENKVVNAITEVMREKLSDFKDPATETGDGGYYPEGTNFDTYNSESIDNYKKSVSNNSLKYYIDNSGKLNVIVTLSLPVNGDGLFNTSIVVE